MQIIKRRSRKKRRIRGRKRRERERKAEITNVFTRDKEIEGNVF
jgi:hypothetical protein